MKHYLIILLLFVFSSAYSKNNFHLGLGFANVNQYDGDGFQNHFRNESKLSFFHHFDLMYKWKNNSISINEFWYGQNYNSFKLVNSGDCFMQNATNFTLNYQYYILNKKYFTIALGGGGTTRFMRYVIGYWLGVDHGIGQNIAPPITYGLNINSRFTLNITKDIHLNLIANQSKIFSNLKPNQSTLMTNLAFSF